MKLHELHCMPNLAALSDEARATLLAQVPDWRLHGQRIEREYMFNNYHETISFVNALAWMIHAQDHHPDLTVRYRHCLVAYTTHSACHAVSLNDMICAAKADAIYEERTRA